MAGDGRRRHRRVPVAFRLAGDGVFGFALGAYDAARRTRDRPVLTYSVAIGGNGVEEATAVALDAQGRIYLAGYTSSTDLPWARIGGAGGKGDVFVARLDPTGQAVQVLAYFGGSESDNVRGLAVDAAGRMHVAGMTLSRDFPVVQPLAGMQTARVRPTPSWPPSQPTAVPLTFSTYLGGSEADEAHGIARRAGWRARRRWRDALDRLPGAQCPPARGPGTRRLRDPNRRRRHARLVDVPRRAGQRQPVCRRRRQHRAPAAVVGTSNSADYPVQQPSQAAERQFRRRRCRASRRPGRSSSRPCSAALATSPRRRWPSTPAGAIHVGGSTTSADFPATNTFGTGRHEHGCVRRHLRIDRATRGAPWRIGGSGIDRARAIAVDATGLYLAGQTSSANFPVVRPVQVGGAGSGDAFVVMLRGASIVYATYLGTSGNDDATGLAVDGVGRVVVTGMVQAMGSANRGPTDAFLYRLSSGDETTDTDNDQLPDAWETQFNLDPRLQRRQRRPGRRWHSPTCRSTSRARTRWDGTRATLPKAPPSRRSRRDWRCSIPNAAPAAVLVRFLCQRACGVPDIPGQDTIVRRLLTLAPFARGTLDVSTVHGLADEEFATILESDQPVVADRTMTWDATAYGSHAETAMTAPASTWYLAEGATINGFRLFYLLQNPNPVEATVTIEYLLGRGLAPVTLTYRLAPQSRATLDVSTQHPSLRAAEVSARIVHRCGNADPGRARHVPECGRPAVRRRVTPAPASRRPRRRGRSPKARPARTSTPSCSIANPSNDATVGARDVPAAFGRHRAAHLRRSPPRAASTSGSIRQRRNSRTPRVSIVLESVDDQPFVAERAMWWPGPAASNWREAHNSPGSLADQRRVGSGRGHARRTERDRHVRAHRQHLAVRRRGPRHAVVRRRRRPRRAGIRRAGRAVASTCRSGIDFPQAMGRRFGTLVESQGTVPAQLVVERAMYADSGRNAGRLARTRWARHSAKNASSRSRPQGVTPRVLVVSPGERITIAISTPSRTRSSPGPYLERSTCPALNQVGYLAPGESRVSGNFSTAGTCPFLDDVRAGQQLNRDFQGYVIVR